MKKSFLALIGTSLLILSGCGGGSTGAEYKEFAQCLSDQDVVMYGAYWCPHCADQKESFGDAFENVTYVECDPKGENANPTLCIEKEITGYPTWIRSDGERVSGNQTLEQLATFSACKLPESAVVPAEETVAPVATPSAEEAPVQ